MIPVGGDESRRFSSQAQERYLRQISLEEIGAEGQARLAGARVLCIGVGGLGSPATMYLAAAGVGTIGIIDPDKVCRTNLHRQLLFSEASVGQAKTEAARLTLEQINPHAEIIAHSEAFAPNNALQIAKDYDLIIDGTDNFSTRYLSNDVAVRLGIPNIYASIYKFEGQLSVFDPATRGGCYRCMFPNIPAPGAVPSCAEGGVLGVLPGIVGTIQATETLKLILGIGTPLTGRLLHIDTLGMKFREFNLRKDPDCPACGTRALDIETTNYGFDCSLSVGSNQTPATRTITPSQLADRLERDPSTVVFDLRGEGEHSFAKIPGAIPVQISRLRDEATRLGSGRTFVVYCSSEQRSAEAADMLFESGFIDVEILEGGIAGWLAEINTSPPPTP